MKKQELIKIIKNTIRKYLFEERGINRELEDEANYIYIQTIKNPDITSLRHSFLGKEILWNISYKNESEKDSGECNATSYFEGRRGFVNIDINKCKGKIDKSLVYDVISHELSHLLKGIKSNNKCGDFDFISLVNTYYNMPRNEYQKKIGLIYYLPLRDEEDSYINGIYVQLKEKKITTTDQLNEFLVQTELFDLMKELNDLKNELSSLFKNEEFLKELRIFQERMPEDINISEKILRQKINRILNRILKKYAMMVRQYFVYLNKCGVKFHINPESRGNNLGTMYQFT